MTSINTHNNLTSEAGTVIDRFKQREFDSIHQDVLKAAAGGDCYFENVEELTPRTLHCDECGCEVTEGAEILDEDGDEIDACYDAKCPECIAKVGGGDAGALEYDEEDEHGFFPALSQMWKCADYIERKIRQDVTVATDAGFRVYEVADEIYLGIHGYGYSMEGPHWAPLYRTVLNQMLPGDPVDCPVCLGGTVDYDDGCPCPSCEGGKVPFVTAQQLREQQREAAMDLCWKLASTGKSVWGRVETREALQQEATRICNLLK